MTGLIWMTGLTTTALISGMGSTGRDGAIQVDYIGFKSGIHEPAAGAAVAPADKLPSMWGEMKIGL